MSEEKKKSNLGEFLIFADVIHDVEESIDLTQKRYARRIAQSITAIVDNAAEDIDKMFEEIMVDKLHKNPDKNKEGVIDVHEEGIHAFGRAKDRLRSLKKYYAVETKECACDKMCDQLPVN